MSDGKEECERLMNEAISFAEKMLRKRKEFYPYAYVLRPNGEVAMIAGYDGTEKPKSQDIIDILRTSLMDEAAAAKVRATAIVYDVRVQSSAGEKSDAIAVALDHRDGFSCIGVPFPYSIRWMKVKIGTPLRNENPLSVFQSLPRNKALDRCSEGIMVWSLARKAFEFSTLSELEGNMATDGDIVDFKGLYA